MKFFLRAVCCGLLLAGLPAQADQSFTAAQKLTEKHEFAEYKAVAAALEPYIIAAKTGDGALTRTAFFDHAHIVGSVNGTFHNRDADSFKGAISQGGASPEVQHHIAWIDISGPAAAAKIEFINWHGLRFTDFFVLYRKDGEWKISGKVYDSHSDN
ncbi:MAG: nuclear transport factor 2 family protein [Stappiaceae bacterium]